MRYVMRYHSDFVVICSKQIEPLNTYIMIEHEQTLGTHEFLVLKTKTMTIALILLLIFHGLIHILGFTKAFSPETVGQLSGDIPKSQGIVWLGVAMAFTAAATLLCLHQGIWWLPATLAVIVSQYLIIVNWQDAKWGTVANVFLLLACIVGYGTWSFSNAYKQEVKKGLQQSLSNQDTLLTEQDMAHLPKTVQRYLRYTGAVGKPKVMNFRVKFVGQIRKNKASEWMPFTSEQYNFMNTPTRLFFMEATMKHLPVAGFHCFKNGNAFMDIRLLSLFKVQYQASKEMGIAETVTFFNDMCCMAPATLISPKIQWMEIDDNIVNATFTNNNISISARLYFNAQGQLINFISEDRYATLEDNTLKQVPWSTPLKDYRTFDGHQLTGYAEAIYSYSKGDLSYGNFRLIQVQYNCKNME